VGVVDEGATGSVFSSCAAQVAVAGLSERIGKPVV
jgi:hypothetical protein